VRFRDRPFAQWGSVRGEFSPTKYFFCLPFRLFSLFFFLYLEECLRVLPYLLIREGQRKRKVGTRAPTVIRVSVRRRFRTLNVIDLGVRSVRCAWVKLPLPDSLRCARRPERCVGFGEKRDAVMSSGERERERGADKGTRDAETKLKKCKPFTESSLVDPASSHMLVSKIKPCMSQCKLN
jgi:hypothetical protein